METLVETKLRPNAEMFCNLYAATRNASQSYKKAYTKNKPTNASCRTLGYNLLTKIDIRRRIDQLTKKSVLDAHIKPIIILNEFAEIAFTNMGDMVDKDFNLKPLHKLTLGQQKSIKKIKKTTTFRYNSDGEKVAGKEVVEVELYDRTKALENLAQFMGILTPEVMKQIFIQVNNNSTNNTLSIDPDDIPVDALERLIEASNGTSE